MSEDQNQLLTAFLVAPSRPQGTLTFHQLQGFLFGLACAPDMIKPSEWMPLIFNDEDPGFADEAEAQAVYQAIFELYNRINLQVVSGEVGLPEDVEILQPPINNVGDETALGQWSTGFAQAHDGMMALWDEYTPDELDEELGSSVMILTFFANRDLAQSYYRELGKPGDAIEAYAATLFDLFEEAMRSYADLGNSIARVLAEAAEPREPRVAGPKIGRNDPCPCGSGKKYKKCCLQ
ncbi:UPF0149 family protein [Thiohalophilus sp.]|uniref:UPF0149 family protein n=1 Tax=Thiohalophilus sp. TaxID=3028392 RepID=UPI002ACDC80C|nr:UPF0149 family protein [Thiohalophilus sp.]MDZ7803628.1 UPF0149 family protein [Thiohalophilus sp.]